MLAGREWLVGERCRVADLAVSSQFDEIVRTSALASAMRERRALAAWLDRLAST
jgi:glutathione S-transferase